MELRGSTVLITGAARRIGQMIAIGLAQEGANIILHHAHADQDALETSEKISSFGVNCTILKADFSDIEQTENFVKTAFNLGPVHGLINNAAIFEPVKFENTTIQSWQQHMNINLTSAFLLSQAMGNQTIDQGRIINILDWRALRPGKDHFPYTISKGALVTLTQASALALAPQITVNGIAFGAILPPSDNNNTSDSIIKSVPISRWAQAEEVVKTILFLLSGPDYITGEIIHLDGGRHLV
jgi:NAD(P)-dependent dehydrogenase (short-subunit alcohol dehydrogenase family)